MTYKRPGVYINEVLLAANADVTPSTAVMAVAGAMPRGPVVPTLITSWTQFRRIFGGFDATGGDNTVAYAVFQHFNNGGPAIWVMRIVGSASAAATRAFNDTATPAVAALDITAVSPGAWANGLYVEVSQASATDRFNLVLRQVPAGAAINDTQIVERWTDLSLNPADSRYAPGLINNPIGGSNFIVATPDVDYVYVAGDTLAASSVGGGDALTGGLDGDAPTHGAGGQLALAVTSFDVIDVPFVLNYPGITDVPTVNALLAYADPAAGGRGDVFVVIDCAAGRTPTQAIADAAGYTETSYGAVYYPRIIISDPASSVPGATVTLPPGGAVLGQIASTDATRGVFKTPAGVQTRLAGALAVETRLTNADLDALNTAGVNAIRSQPGTGICIFAGRTLKPSPADKYIAIRRTLINIESQLRAVTAFAPFEPNDALLWAHLESVCENVVRELWQAGGLKGDTPEEAFFVKCDEDTNTDVTVENGEVHIEVGVALEYPAEFIVITIGQFDGGSSVTENAA